MRLRHALGLFLLMATAAQAAPIGETHRVATDRTAALRNADGSADLAITIWYPAAATAVEQPLTIGPPAAPLFTIGSVAPAAPFAPGPARYPVIVLSHGFGGSARMMGWFGIAMARTGAVVVAVDHPGNSAAGTMTVAGALLVWERADDLRIALQAVADDPVLGPHLDLDHVGVAGFSAGGYAALLAAGARGDMDHYNKFCLNNPFDGMCLPQREFPITARQRQALFQSPAAFFERPQIVADYTLPGLRAAFVMAPALVQAVSPLTFKRIHVPTTIVLGDSDSTAPPSTNGRVAADAIPDAQLVVLPDVGHYDFLATCTQAARASIPWCATDRPQEQTHAAIIAAATALFAKTLH